MAYGLLATGFAKKDLATCLQELKDAVHATFGTAQDTDDPSGPWAQLLGVLADRESELWDLAAAVYSSRDPAQAAGSALDAICAITGTVRFAPVASTALLTLSGTAGTVIPAGSVVAVTGSGITFASTADATIGGGGFVSGVPFACTVTGPRTAPAGTLTQIQTPVAGWTGATNPADATIGRDLEADAALRLRRVAGIALGGNATLNAIRSQVLAVPGVTSCYVFDNPTSGTVGGMPPFSIEVLALGGADQDVANAIFASKAAGPQLASGIGGATAVSKTATDAQGFAHAVVFDRPAVLAGYLIVNLKKDPSIWTTANDATQKAAVQAALVAQAAQALRIGTDFVTRTYLAPIFGVAGVKDVTNLYVGTAPSPTSEANVGVTARQLLQLDTSRITVNATDWSETP